jgi:hypothetical protein
MRKYLKIMTMTIKYTLIQTIENLPEETMTEVLSDVLNYLRTRLDTSVHLLEPSKISQLIESIRRDREALLPQSTWLDTTALIREERDQ